MTDRIIRIKASRQPYRRGGLNLGSTWLEVDTSDLSEGHQVAVLRDPLLTIEGREGDGWTPLPADIREGLAHLIVGAAQVEGGPAEIAEPADTLTGACDDHEQNLADLGLVWAQPTEVIPGLIAQLLAERSQADAALVAKDQAIADLTAEKAGLQLQLGEAENGLTHAKSEVDRLTAEVETLTEPKTGEGGDASAVPAASKAAKKPGASKPD